MSTIYDKKLKMKFWRIPVGIPGISKVPIYGIYVKKNSVKFVGWRSNAKKYTLKCPNVQLKAFDLNSIYGSKNTFFGPKHPILWSNVGLFLTYEKKLPSFLAKKWTKYDDFDLFL